MSALITDAIVEAALEASYDPPKEPGHTFLNRDSYRSLWKHHMRAALEAVAPLIAKEVWYDGFEAGATWIQYTPPNIPNAPPLNPYEEKL